MIQIRISNTYTTLLFLTVLLTFNACKNRDVNEGEQFKPREIHEKIHVNFDKIEVDGIEYLILEKDNNNPHEGFGFMAFRANKLMEKQDTILAYLRASTDLQVRIYAALTKRPINEVSNEARELLLYYLTEEEVELEQLEQNDLSGTTTTTNKQNPE